mgnify:FL=1
MLAMWVSVVVAQTPTTTTTASVTNTTTPSATVTSTTTGNPGANTTTTTPAPGTNGTTPEPAGLPGSLPNVSCPFSKWQGEPRYCYECRWCPFRASTCCEMEDEIDMLKSVNVSGTNDWDCFITIVHFQQCGRCDPRSRDYVQGKLLNYVWDIRNVSIRPCKQACRYIYARCKRASTLSGQPVVPEAMTEDEFCANAPTSATPGEPCYDAASPYSYAAAVVAFVALSLWTMMNA